MSFSIAMCTFNGARYLDEQIASFCAQTLLPAELVVCDDRSEDDTASVVRRWSERAPFPLRFHENESRLGSTKNFERAIGLASAELIALSDQDDVWHPDKLELLKREFDRDPTVGVVFSDAEVVDERLEPLGFGMFEHDRFTAAGKQALRSDRRLSWMLTQTFVAGMTLAFRSRFKGLVLPLPDHDPFLIHDRWLVLLIGAVARVEFVDRPLVKYRQHGKQQIGAQRLLGTRPGVVPSKTQRAENYLAASATLRLIEERVRSYQQGGLSRRDGEALRSFARHLEARARMIKEPKRRPLAILRELASLRYFRHSRGMLSVVKDLLD